MTQVRLAAVAEAVMASQGGEQVPAGFAVSQSRQPSPKNPRHPALPDQLDGPQRALEEATREKLGALAAALQAVQVDAFRHVREQLSQLALENLHLREQLGDGTSGGGDTVKSQHLVQPDPRIQTDPDFPKVLVRPATPMGECAVLDLEAFTLPNSMAFTEPPKNRSDAATTLNKRDMLVQRVSSNSAAPIAVRSDAWTAGGSALPTTLACQNTNATEKMSRPQLLKSRHAGKARMADILNSHRASIASRARAIGNGTCENGHLSRKGSEDVTQAASRKSNRSRLFPDKTELMDRVQKTLSKPEYKVTNYYHQDGLFQKIARSFYFESITLAVICLNSLWIAIDTDYNTEPLDPPQAFVIIENLFCGFFFFELLIRFLAFDGKKHCCKDAWFVFDFILVTVAVLETWVMKCVELITGLSAASLTGRSGAMLRLLRMARLARTARMARLLRAVPELMIMFKGMVVASHAVMCTIFLLAVIIYIFSLCLRQLTTGTDLGDTHFRSVPFSMGTLLLRGTLPDFGDFVYDLSDAHIVFGTFGLCFVLLTTLVVLNMLAGVLVNAMLMLADLEKEEAEATFVRNALPVLLERGDTDGDGTISKQEFDHLLCNPEATMLLEQVNVDVMGLVELSDFIFCSGEERLAFEDFFRLLLKLRGTQSATVKDIVEMRKYFGQEIISMETYLGDLMQQVISQTRTAATPELL